MEQSPNAEDAENTIPSVPNPLHDSMTRHTNNPAIGGLRMRWLQHGSGKKDGCLCIKVMIGWSCIVTIIFIFIFIFSVCSVMTIGVNVRVIAETWSVAIDPVTRSSRLEQVQQALLWRWWFAIWLCNGCVDGVHLMTMTMTMTMAIAIQVNPRLAKRQHLNI